MQNGLRYTDNLPPRQFEYPTDAIAKELRRRNTLLTEVISPKETKCDYPPVCFINSVKHAMVVYTIVLFCNLYLH